MDDVTKYHGLGAILVIDWSEFRRIINQCMLLPVAGEADLKMPKYCILTFETAIIIHRHQCGETRVEEVLVEMYLTGVSTRPIEDINETLWDANLSAGTVSRLNGKVYEQIETWPQRPLEGQYPYVYLDGVYLKRNCWGGY